MTKHPTDRRARLRLKKLKYEEKERTQERASHLRKKLFREATKEKESQDDLHGTYR